MLFFFFQDQVLNGNFIQLKNDPSIPSNFDELELGEDAEEEDPDMLFGDEDLEEEEEFVNSDSFF